MSDVPNNPPGGAPPPPEGQSAPPPAGAQPPPGGAAPPPGGQQPPPVGAEPPPPVGAEPPPPVGAEPPPVAQPAAGTAGQPADLGTRLIAKVIDTVICGIVIAPIWVVLGIALAVSGLPGIISRIVSYGLATAVYLGYFAYMESSKGQSVGKMLMKLEVRAASGGKPTMEEAVKRNIYFGASLIAIIPFVGPVLSSLAWLGAVIYGIISINNNEQTRQGWHDMFAGGTWVLKTE